MKTIIKWGLYGLLFGSILSIINLLTSDISGMSGYGIMIFRIASIVLTVPLGLIGLIVSLDEFFFYIFLPLNWLLIGIIIGNAIERRREGKKGLIAILILIGVIVLGGLYVIDRIASSIGTL